MQPTRRTQPYRRSKGRPKGQTLSAMTRGRGVYGNPQDAVRQTQKRRRRRPAGQKRVSLY